jgi:hypothetical protein
MKPSKRPRRTAIGTPIPIPIFAPVERLLELEAPELPVSVETEFVIVIVFVPDSEFVTGIDGGDVMVLGSTVGVNVLARESTSASVR